MTHWWSQKIFISEVSDEIIYKNSVMNVEARCLYQGDGNWYFLRSVATQTILWVYVVFSGQRADLECWWVLYLNCLLLGFLSSNKNKSLKLPCMCILFPELCCRYRLDQGSSAQIKCGAQLWSGLAVQCRDGSSPLPWVPRAGSFPRREGSVLAVSHRWKSVPESLCGTATQLFLLLFLPAHLM